MSYDGYNCIWCGEALPKIRKWRVIHTLTCRSKPEIANSVLTQIVIF